MKVKESKITVSGTNVRATIPAEVVNDAGITYEDYSVEWVVPEIGRLTGYIVPLQVGRNISQIQRLSPSGQLVIEILGYHFLTGILGRGEWQWDEKNVYISIK